MSKRSIRNAFVAFIDLMGFKYRMNEGQALKDLENFYAKSSYWLHRDQMYKIHGVFFSDSAVLWTEESLGIVGMRNLLETIKVIFWSLVNEDLIPTASITFGEFSYPGSERSGLVEVFPIYGKAYTDAYIDNEKHGKTAGICRIFNCPKKVNDWFKSRHCDYVIEKKRFSIFILLDVD